MNIVSQENWSFDVSDSAISNHGNSLKFQTAGELIKRIGNDADDLSLRIHNQINDRIDNDPVAKGWKRQRTLLKNLKHFLSTEVTTMIDTMRQRVQCRPVQQIKGSITWSSVLTLNLKVQG